MQRPGAGPTRLGADPSGPAPVRACARALEALGPRTPKRCGLTPSASCRSPSRTVSQGADEPPAPGARSRGARPRHGGHSARWTAAGWVRRTDRGGEPAARGTDPRPAPENRQFNPNHPARATFGVLSRLCGRVNPNDCARGVVWVPSRFIQRPGAPSDAPARALVGRSGHGPPKRSGYAPQPARRSPSRAVTQGADEPPGPGRPGQGRVCATGGARPGERQTSWGAEDGLRRRTRGARNGPPPGAGGTGSSTQTTPPRNVWGPGAAYADIWTQTIAPASRVWGPEPVDATPRRQGRRARGARRACAPLQPAPASQPSASPPFTKPHSHPGADEPPAPSTRSLGARPGGAVGASSPMNGGVAEDRMPRGPWGSSGPSNRAAGGARCVPLVVRHGVTARPHEGVDEREHQADDADDEQDNTRGLDVEAVGMSGDGPFQDRPDCDQQDRCTYGHGECLPGDPGRTTRSGSAARVAQLALNVADHVALADRLALVVEVLAARQRDLDLGP